MKHTPLIRIAAPLCLLLLSACSVLAGGGRDSVTIYAPEARVTPDPNWPAVNWQLVIAKPSAERLIDSPRINVRPTPGQLEVYRGATWSQPATDMLEDIVLRAFEDSERIPAVARIASGIRSDYKLTLDLRRFESDYRNGSTPAATIELNAKLIHSLDQRIVAARTLTVAEPATTTDTAQVVRAFDQALQQIATDLVGWTLTTGQQDQLRLSAKQPR